MKIKRKYYVIGGANIDLLGKSNDSLNLSDSNPGVISMSFGGVARNIAENLARMKEEVVFLSVFGDDGLGRQCLEHLNSLSIDTSFSVIVKHRSSSTYMAIANAEGEMVSAIADMGILEELNQTHLDRFLKQINRHDILVMDTNLSESMIDYITSACKGIIAVDPISSKKAVKIIPFLSRVSVFKPNRIEAEVVCGFAIEDDESLMKALLHLRSYKIKHVIISLGSQGGVVANDKGIYRYRTKEFDIISVTGAGDAFLASYVANLGESVEENIEAAVSASMIACCSEHTVHPKMSIELITDFRNRNAVMIEKRWDINESDLEADI
ncbi:MAG TPA: hypothetical protein DEA51_05535 [Erysipelotrichaceae bacterium]|nr:hypothetical protein [Erysipelotrichaceae bacterium]